MMEALGEKGTSAENKTNPRSPIESAAATRKGSHGFLQKLFSRQPSAPALKAMDFEDDIMHKPLEDTSQLICNDLKVLPCPYIRPLQTRLEPRLENAQVVHRRPVADSARPTLSKKPDSIRAVLNDLPPDSAGELGKSHIAAMDCMESRGQRLREEVALAATTDATHLQEWLYYIKCYSEGCYNLIKPPDPPPLNPSFSYLLSTYPSNEVERLATFESSSVWSGTDIIWSESEAELARSLIKAADVRFNAPWGAISFFDTEMEIVQAERGYSRHFIPRHESIASHVLLANEVMTILDTKKDWRFAGNPLVVGEPRIRFFAGAPLLSANSEVIGVFAVFSPEARTTFTARQRRELTIFSEMAMRELTSLIEVNHDESLQTPPLSKDVPGLFTASGSNTASQNEDGGTCSPGITPPALQYHKPSHHHKTVSRVVISSRTVNACSSPWAHSPPDSDLSHAGSSISTKFNSFGENHEQLSTISGSTISSKLLDSPEGLIVHDSLLNPSQKSSQSISVSNAALEFLSKDNCNTISEPEVNGASVSAGIDQPITKMSTTQSATSVPTETSEDIIAVPKINPMNQSDNHDSLSSAYQFGRDCEWPIPSKCDMVRFSASRRTTGTGNLTETEIAKPQNNKMTFGSPSSYKTSDEEQAPADPFAEASFAAEFWAKHLGFDTIYAVELVPKKFFVTEDDLNAPGAIETRTMVAYGLQEPIEFDILMHLNVLRTTGAMTWENTHGSPKEYSIGFMMPLKVNPGLLAFRSIGVVFGAFKKTNEEAKQTPKISLAEIKRLQQAARVLRNIFRKSVPVKKATQLETKCPPTPTRKGCLSNEAADLGKYSFDGSSDHLPMKKKSSRRLPRKP